MSRNEWWVVDRIEDDKQAVLVSDSGQEEVVARERLPRAVEEGTVLRLEGQGEEQRYVIDRKEEEQRRTRAKELRESLRPGPQGRLSL